MVVVGVGVVVAVVVVVGVGVVVGVVVVVAVVVAVAVVVGVAVGVAVVVAVVVAVAVVMTPPQPSPRRSPPMALCPHCLAPLISTCLFPGAEFYCLECGAHVGFLSPRPGEVTPELQTRYDALLAEWDEHADPFLRGHGGWYEWCEQCEPHGEPHRAHATEQEWVAHEEALAWLKQRVTAGAGAR